MEALKNPWSYKLEDMNPDPSVKNHARNESKTMNTMYTLMHYEFMINTCEAIEEESNGLVVFRSNEVAITKEW